MVREVPDPRLPSMRCEDDLGDLSEIGDPQNLSGAQSKSTGGGKEKKRTLKKQISIFVPVEDWRHLRHYAAERKTSMTAIVRRLLRPAFRALRDGDDPLAGDAHEEE